MRAPRSQPGPPGGRPVLAALLGLVGVLLACRLAEDPRAGSPPGAPADGPPQAQAAAFRPASGPVGAVASTSPRAPEGPGSELYLRHCSVCHGETGRGDGPASYLLYPAPRDFGSGSFRLASTDNGVPTPSDLIATIRRGMPGSAMPPWEWLAEEDLWNLAEYVRSLAIEGQVADLLAWAQEDEEDLPQAEARRIATGKLQAGGSVDPGAALDLTPEVLHAGARLYTKLCASCHADDGTGRVPIELWNEDGSPTRSRDFTAGIFKGPSTQEAIATRILAGLSGSPMPATPLDDRRDARRIAAYVQSLIKPGAEERVLLRRKTIRVAHVSALPADGSDAAWQDAPATWIALTPLWWRDQRVEGVLVRTVHDGQKLAVRMSWRDGVPDDELLDPAAFSDNAAIELSTETDPPLFAMGATGQPVDIVLWRAAWEQEASRARDVEDRHPNMWRDQVLERMGALADAAVTARAQGNGQAVAARGRSSEDLVAQGFGTVGPRLREQAAAGERVVWSTEGRWQEGYWEVVFTRDLEPYRGSPAALAPGGHAFMAFAVWDGQAGDRNGQKSVSVWHRLEIER